jgi:nicotinate-nucleotide adenylyltransferase
MKIAILGGSFDPPHIGHLFITQQVKEHLHMDQIWLMPAYHHPFNKTLSDVAKRYEMVKLMENETTKVSDYEIKHNNESYSIDTLRGLEKAHPEHTFYWIFGSDQLNKFKEFKEWKSLAADHNLIFFPREWILPQFREKILETLERKEIPGNITFMQSEQLILTNISSSKIRDRFTAGLPLRYYVIDSVEEYIKKNKLYIDSAGMTKDE